MTRVMLDVNLYISYLLAPDASTVVQRLCEAAIIGRFALIAPDPLIAELTRKVREKPYLTARISSDQLGRLVATLLEVREPVPSLHEPAPSVLRDHKDDYLLAYAVLADADYLVSGDKDLQAVAGSIVRPANRTPATFVREFGLVVDDIE